MGEVGKEAKDVDGEGRQTNKVGEPYFDDLQHSDDDEDAEEPEDDAVRSVAC